MVAMETVTVVSGAVRWPLLSVPSWLPWGRTMLKGTFFSTCTLFSPAERRGCSVTFGMLLLQERRKDIVFSTLVLMQGFDDLGGAGTGGPTRASHILSNALYRQPVTLMVWAPHSSRTLDRSQLNREWRKGPFPMKTSQPSVKQNPNRKHNFSEGTQSAPPGHAIPNNPTV